MVDRLIKKILVAGVGKVGSLVGELLHYNGFTVVGLDCRTDYDLPFEITHCNFEDIDSLKSTVQGFDAVVSCLPFSLNINIARVAHSEGLHYFDLTEDVQISSEVRKMAKNTKTVLAPQCGLAPGFISIVGSSLAKKFDTLRSIELRVGALPNHPKGLLGYAFNWSPEGVVNEYLNDCEVVTGGEVKMVPAMQGHETIVINGKVLEAYSTSGGLGTMCETYAGKVAELNYKTMRYPGHFELMRFYFHELLMKEDPINAGKILVNAKPPVNDDVVYVHAAVEGWKTSDKSINGLYREEFVKAYYPKEIYGKPWRAISWTTASAVTSVVEMVAEGKLPSQGFIKQEDIPLEDLFATKIGAIYQSSSHHC